MRHWTKITDNSNVKVGDWYLCEMELHQVTKINTEFNTITLSDGTISSTGKSNLFPLDLRLLPLSKYALNKADEVRKISNINTADVLGHMDYLWELVCEEILKEDKISSVLASDRLWKFIEDVNNPNNHTTSSFIDGVKVLR